MQYYWGELIPNKGNGTFNLYKEISNEEFIRLSSFRNNAERFFRDLDYLLMVEEAHDQLSIQIQSSIQNADFTNLLLLRKSSRIVQFQLFNLLNLVRAMRDHLSVKLIGKKKDDFKKLWSKYYDTYFEFRFFERLRNYSQHQRLPISEISFNQSKEVNLKINVLLDRDILLKSDYWSKVGNELNTLPEQIEIVPMLANYSKQISLVFGEYLEIEREMLSETFTGIIVSSSIKNIYSKGGHFGIICTTDTIKDGVSEKSVTIENPFFEYLDIVQKYLPNLAIVSI